MKSIACQNEMLLKKQIFKFTEPTAIPLSFTYGDRVIHGIPADFKTTVTRNIIDANITLYQITAQDEKGLEIRVEYKEYNDYPATEWVAYFQNKGTENTDILSDIRIADGVICGEDPVLWHGIGDTCRDNGYNWDCTPITEKIEKVPNDGTSCNGAFPYMRLMNKSFGVNIAVGWTSKWCADFTPTENGVHISIGQKRCHMRIYPGETIRTPRVNFVAFIGDDNRGINMWRRWYLTHILPRKNGAPIPPKCCMHLFQEDGFAEFTGATEKGQLRALDNYLKNGIHPDVFWIDAGWYPCDHNWFGNVGNWRPDPERFPNGLTPIGKKCAENNIEFLLWFEPERAPENSVIAKEHPEWMLRAKNADGTYGTQYLVNLGIPECCDYIINVIDGVIKKSGINVYRQDFNFNPEPNWTTNEADDRIGALENLHVQGYYRLWDSLLERNPGLWIDSCASGGRRNDLETMRRAVTLHYTDVGYGNHPIKQLQHRRMFEWIPYFRAHAFNWDNPETGEYNTPSRPTDKFAFYVALTPALTDPLFHEADEEMYAISRLMQPIWRRAAELMLSCDYYPLTECRKSRDDFYAMAFYSPENGNGFVNVVSNNNNKETTFTAKLDMLESDTTYTLTEAESGDTKDYTGAQLASGLKIEMSPRSGIIYFIEKK